MKKIGSFKGEELVKCVIKARVDGSDAFLDKFVWLRLILAKGWEQGDEDVYWTCFFLLLLAPRI
jgi:hypothetical protein